MLVVLSGCSVPIARGLDEADANLVVVALEEGGVVASKEPDAESEGRWSIRVARDDASAAASVLKRESLPPASAPGVLQALGGGSLVPSRTSEHAKLVAGIAGDLERSLRSIDGVLSARVHLAVAPRDVLAAESGGELPTASVLLRHRGPTPPLASDQVQRLVAGAVPGLTPERVSVVSSPSALPAAGVERDLARVGPLTVTRSSVGPLRWIVSATVFTNLLALGFAAFAWVRARRTQLALDDARAPGARQDAR